MSEEQVIDYDSLDDHHRMSEGLPLVHDTQMLKDKKIQRLKNFLKEKLKDTDYVHTSEFLTEEEKQEILSERRELKNKYDLIKSEIENSETNDELGIISIRDL